MSRLTTGRRLLAVAALAALSLGSLGPAGATTQAPLPPTAPGGGPVTSSVSELYTSITPCRIIDTRLVGGPLVSVRHFDVSGNLASQGGASTCGIPPNATSIAANITAITAAGRGYLRGWPYFTLAPNATLVNYGDLINMSNMVNIPLCEGVACVHAFDMRGYGAPADAVVDVLGYYQRSLFASLSATGARGNTSGVLATARPSIGLYTVNFDRLVDSCTASVTSTDPSNVHSFAVTPHPGAGHIVRIHVRDVNGALADAPFNIRMTC
ncbi:hypothetical protein ACE2AJ_09535 [Aquihabitans daechungensis]|uniref:hypothetical protein n=1 Tax=Aquihabitans daechungensis TaxID=1052257 RepID=UPI003BA1108A